MSEHKDSSLQAIWVLRKIGYLSKTEMDELRVWLESKVGTSGSDTDEMVEALGYKVFDDRISDLIDAMKEQTRANQQLGMSIRAQADAIADLAEAVTAQQDDGDEPEGLGHLGTL